MKVVPCSFSFHLDKNGGVGPIIWSLPKTKLVFCRVCVLNTFVLILPFLCLPTRPGNKSSEVLQGWGLALIAMPQGFLGSQIRAFQLEESGWVLPSPVPFQASHSGGERQAQLLSWEGGCAGWGARGCRQPLCLFPGEPFQPIGRCGMQTLYLLNGLLL